MTPTKLRITSREKQVLKLIAEGSSSKQIATSLRISLKTVETHRKNMLAKFSAINACNMVYIAVKNNYL